MQMKLREVILSMDQLDDFWISKIIALYDLRARNNYYLYQNKGLADPPAAFFLTVVFSDLSEIFPRDTSNPLVGRAFKSYQQSIRAEKEVVKALFEMEGFNDELEIEIENPPGTSWSGYGSSS
jgi:hypothetical protein